MSSKLILFHAFILLIFTSFSSFANQAGGDSLENKRSSQVSDEVLLAQNKQKKTKRRKRRKSRDSFEISRSYNVEPGFKAGLGVVFAEETTYLLNADFEYPVYKWIKGASKGISTVIGIHYFSYSQDSLDVSLFGFEFGSDYHFAISESVNIYGGMRLSIGRLSIEGDTIIGSIENNETNTYLTPVLGLGYALGKLSLGAEIRLPIEEEIDASYILLLLKIPF